jgi:hypothetical protein
VTVLLFGILPAVVALAVIVIAVQSIIRAFSAVQLAIGLPAVASATWSLWVLKRIVIDGAWATYLPHLTIIATIPLAAIQWTLARRRPEVRGTMSRALLFVGATLVAISLPPLVGMFADAVATADAAQRYSVEPLTSQDAVGGALRAEIGGHVVSLEDDHPYDPSRAARADGSVRILIDGRDYSTSGRVAIRLESRDANRYWGYVYLMKLIDHQRGSQHLVVAQNVDGRLRTLMVSADGTVLEDRFDYDQRCERPVRVLLMESVVPSPIGRCFGTVHPLSPTVYPVVYPWITAALGVTWVTQGFRQTRRRRYTTDVGRGRT